MRLTITGKKVRDLCELHEIDPQDGNRVLALLRQIYQPRSLRMVSYLSPFGTSSETWEIWT